MRNILNVAFFSLLFLTTQSNALLEDDEEASAGGNIAAHQTLTHIDAAAKLDEEEQAELKKLCDWYESFADILLDKTLKKFIQSLNVRELHACYIRDGGAMAVLEQIRTYQGREAIDMEFDPEMTKFLLWQKEAPNEVFYFRLPSIEEGKVNKILVGTIKYEVIMQRKR